MPKQIASACLQVVLLVILILLLMWLFLPQLANATSIWVKMFLRVPGSDRGLDRVDVTVPIPWSQSLAQAV